MADTFFDKIYKSKTSHTPDVLSCLANLSNDEVFTPPGIVNQMLDLLPQELFRDPNTTFLDPACKTGVFLREIAKQSLQACFPAAVCIAANTRTASIPSLDLTPSRATSVSAVYNTRGSATNASFAGLPKTNGTAGKGRKHTLTNLFTHQIRRRYST